MKNIILFLLSVLFSTSIFAQTELRGVVTYQNTGKLMEAIQVTARGASPVISKANTDGQGIFKLLFPNKSPGETVILNIENRRYDLVNHERELEVILPKKGELKQVRLVICNKGDRDANAVKLYEISTDYITKSYKQKLAEKDKNIAEANTKLAQGQITKAELERQIAAINTEKANLEQQFQELDATAWKLAEDFANVDFAQANETYKTAYQLFQEGKIDKARTLLKGDKRQENIDKIKQSDKELKSERANLEAMKNAIGEQEQLLSKKEDTVYKAKGKEIQNYLLEANLAKLQLDFDAVELAYQNALELEESNIDLLWYYAIFLAEQNKHEQSILIYKQGLTQAKNENTKAEFLNNLGAQFIKINNFPKAEATYFQVFKILKQLAKYYPQVYEPNLAMAQMNLGGMYYLLNDYSKAKVAYLQALEIYKKLAKKNPKLYEYNLAQTQQGFGNIYLYSNSYPKAEVAYLQALEIYKKLAKKNPQRFEPDLANIQTNLGALYYSDKNYHKAEAAYLQSLEIFKRLTKRNRQHYEPYLAVTQLNLGLLYDALKNYFKSEAAYLQSLEIFKRLVKENPKSYESDLALTQMNLGNMYSDLNDYPKAKIAFLKSIEIYKRLAKENPQRFESDLAKIQVDLGNMYSDLNDYPKAKVAFLKSIEIYKRLAKENPQHFESDLAKTQVDLGNMYFDLNDYPQAKVAFLKSIEIYKRLAKGNPQCFEPILALTQMLLGDIYIHLDDYLKAETAYLESLGIYKQLAKENPQRFEPDLAKTQMDLGNMYSDLNDYPKAEEAYLQALEIHKQLAIYNPQQYNQDVCLSLITMSYLIQSLFESTLLDEYRVKGLAYLMEAQRILQASTANSPVVQLFKSHADSLETYFSSINKEDLVVLKEIQKTKEFESKNIGSTTYEEKVSNQEEIVKILENILSKYPKNKTLIEKTSNAYGSMAWYYLFTKQFQKTEQAALRGLELNSSQEWINTNLALGLLFQGKFEAAEALYLQMKDMPYGDGTYKTTFLEDLAVLEKEGITHPDVAKIQALLEN